MVQVEGIHPSLSPSSRPAAQPVPSFIHRLHHLLLVFIHTIHSFTVHSPLRETRAPTVRWQCFKRGAVCARRHALLMGVAFGWNLKVLTNSDEGRVEGQVDWWRWGDQRCEGPGSFRGFLVSGLQWSGIGLENDPFTYSFNQYLSSASLVPGRRCWREGGEWDRCGPWPLRMHCPEKGMSKDTAVTNQWGSW